MDFLQENESVTAPHFATETASFQIEDTIQPESKVECSNQNINEVWTKENLTKSTEKKGYVKASLSLDIKPLKTTWASKKNTENEEDKIKCESEFKETLSSTPTTPDKEVASPSHHARRPMNAFLIFCKKHRPIVRQRFPHLENRGVTRILGEWWALLDIGEKSAYTSLAKEYKDAFFSANPDFKWYKLPAPPLRTLNTRPLNVHRTSSSPLASPTQVTVNCAEFTPGKLADETQLGNLTSLMKSGSSNNCETNTIFDNDVLVKSSSTKSADNEDTELQKTPTPELAVISTPPKPIKKRKLEEFIDTDNKKVARNIFDIKANEELFVAVDQNDNSYIEELYSPEQEERNCLNGFHKKEPENMTQQELMNKVVDSMYAQTNDLFEPNGKWTVIKPKSKETRKSVRSCKGKRYAEFMMEGKLLGNKQMKRLTHYKLDLNNKFEDALNNKIDNLVHNKTETQTPKLDLGDTIKRLAERTNTKLEDICEQTSEGILHKHRKRTESETSDDSIMKLQADFNLDLRIAELPSLSYEIFLQRKKDSKKRKSVRSKSESCITKAKVAKLSKSESNLVGSKKRKNKNNIIRLEKPVEANYMSNYNNDLYGLATLAEVASHTEKIN